MRRPDPPDPEKTLAELALEQPGAARVLRDLRLDYALHGRATLRAECSRRRLPLDDVLCELTRAAESAEGEDETLANWSECPLGGVVDHLVDHYHRQHLDELARLIDIASRVDRAHGEKASCPKRLVEHLVKIEQGLEEHMQHEEQTIYPQIVAGRARSVVLPIQVMCMEHEELARDLDELRALTCDYSPPDAACRAWRELYEGMARLDGNLRHHMHLENNVIYRRALQGC